MSKQDLNHSRMVFLAIGNCHAPSIPHESLVEVRSCSPSDVRSGDVVVYSGFKALICHRVIFRKKKEGMLWFLIKPDNSLVDDGWIPAYRIVGKVVGVNDKLWQQDKTRMASRLLLWRSRFQWWVFHYLFCSRIGEGFRKFRQEHISGKPLISDFYFKLTSPWLWGSGLKRQWEGGIIFRENHS